MNGYLYRKTRAILLPFACLVAAVTLFLVSVNPASAIKRQDKAIYGYTTSPYWHIGTYSHKLSRACQRREFSQKRQYRYIIAFVGDKGRAITGIASSTWNLYDPNGLAEARQTYHFFNDGFSNCKVYVSPQPDN